MLLKPITIKAPFNERYTLVIDSDLKAVNAVMQSKTQLRWDLTVLKTDNTSVEIRLILLDQVLLEANNPLVHEVAKLTKTFSRMYNELHLLLDHKGIIIDIFNSAEILTKWRQTKKELEALAESSPDIKSIITLNDNIFESKEQLIATVQRSEFFLLYFNTIYGNNVPTSNPNVMMPNFLNTANVNWEKRISLLDDTNDKEIEIGLSSKPVFLPKDFTERAYGQFRDQLDIKKLKPNLSEKGIYIIDNTNGKLLNAHLIRQETADVEELFNKLEYKFYCDAYADKAIKNMEALSTMN